MANCMATGAQTQIAYVKEDTWGVTPNSPTLQEVGRRSGGAPVLEKPLLSSQMIRSDRQMAPARTGNKNVNVPLTLESRFGEQDEFFEALLGDTFTTTTENSVGVDFDVSGTITRSVGDWSTNFSVNDAIKIAGSTSNNGVFTITDLTATVLTVSEAVVTEATATIDVQSIQLQNGTDVTSFTFQEYYADLNDTDKYLAWVGARPNTLALSSTIDDHITMTWEFIGKDGGIPSDVSLGTVNGQTDNESMIHYDGAIYLDNTAIANITALTLNVNNKIANEYVLGTDSAGCQAIGAIEVTGTFDALFSNFNFQEWQTSETPLSLKLVMADPAGNTYVLFVDEFKLGTVTRNIEENRITEGIPFTAYVDETTNKTIRLFKASA